jgi:sensor histidine kinase YesM
METSKEIKIPSRTKLILLSSLAITVLFSLPRALVMFQLGQADFDTDFKMLDAALRTVYCFLFAIVFFTVNLENKKFHAGPFHIDPDRLPHRIAINVVLFVLIDLALLRFHLAVFDPLTPERLFRFVFNLSLILEAIFVLLISQIYRLLFKNYRVKIENEMLSKTNAEARYEALKNQVNPHFLFNSFNTVNSLIGDDPQKAVDYVNNMSDVFRYVLESSEKSHVTVARELTFIEAYARMLKDRYGDKIDFVFDVQEQHLSCLIPPMALQILVENAVKHNVISQSRHLNIRVYSENDTLAVSNTLQMKKSPEPSTGLGLHNLARRCEYLAGRELVVKRTESEFTVAIPLIPNEP